MKSLVFTLINFFPDFIEIKNQIKLFVIYLLKKKLFAIYMKLRLLHERYVINPLCLFVLVGSFILVIWFSFSSVLIGVQN